MDLIMDLIPCYRKTDSEIGFFDIVNNKFYRNSGTGTFLKGNSANELQEEKYVLSTKIPKSYQEVEYIEATGEQVITTNIQSAKLITAEIDAQFTAGTSNSQLLLWIDTYATNWVGQNNSQYSVGASNRLEISCTERKTLNVEFDSSSITLEIDGLTTTRTGTHNNNKYYSIFYKNGTWNSKVKLFKLTVKENNIVIGNFIPCYRKSDGEIGLYDTIEEVFLTNAGTGKFEKGPDVN